MSETSTSESLPEWQANKDVQHLAEAILQEKRFQDLPILADALFDAGFSDEGALQSLRNPEYQDHFQYWTEFYQTYFKDINILDVLAVRFPERTPEQEKDYTKPIIMAKGLTPNKIYQALEKAGQEAPESSRFTMYRYIEDLDSNITENDRDPNQQGTYAIWIKDQKESQDYANQSANDLKAQNIPCTTTAEDLVRHLEYWHQNQEKSDPNQQHPDNNLWTLSSGSRYSASHVPFVRWSPGFRRLHVDLIPPDDHSPFMRSRSVVSLPSAASEA